MKKPATPKELDRFVDKILAFKRPPRKVVKPAMKEDLSAYKKAAD